MPKFLIIFLILISNRQNAFADEFPWVQKIIFHDSITWVLTNDGLYKILQQHNKIQWSKELPAASDLFMDTQSKIWVPAYGDGLYINQGKGWELIQNDTVKWISNMYEFEATIYILTTIAEEKCFLMWADNKWKLITKFNPDHGSREGAYGLVVNKNGIFTRNNFYDNKTKGFVDYFYRYDNNKWTTLKKNVTDMYFDQHRNAWTLFYPNGIEYDGVFIKAPNGERIWQHHVDNKGVPWVSNEEGRFFRYDDDKWIASGAVPSRIYNKALSFWIKDAKYPWIGGYAFVAYYDGENWIELSFLIPQAHQEGPEEEAEYVEPAVPVNWGVIKDDDGYTNVREGPDASSKIIAKILSRVEFTFKENSNSDWWPIETQRGTRGYVHKYRIQKL